MNRRTISLYAVTMAFTFQELYSDDLHVSETCSTATLNGSYEFYSTGNTADRPLARVGIIIFDGNGTETQAAHQQHWKIRVSEIFGSNSNSCRLFYQSI
ncbi:MAG TPA: hypothetical protein VLH08_17305 [Acidobacteriota bacterium]|nr:hypothetical protein [Acidobacteriota bacterium]